MVHSNEIVPRRAEREQTSSEPCTLLSWGGCMATAKIAGKAKGTSKGAAKGSARATTKRAAKPAPKAPKRDAARAPAKKAPPKKAAAKKPAPRKAAAPKAAPPKAAPRKTAPRKALPESMPAAPPIFDGPVLELETIRQEVLLPSDPHAVFDAYVDGARHAAFTGSAAESTPRVGGRFRAYDGYIDGVFLELVRGKRIVQSWRATDFPPEYPHSRLELSLEPEGSGTRVVMRHSEVPRSMAPAYAGGWEEFYWEPLRKYLVAR
jgi:uncharacterized protein YndB with AHSA1/START domain